MSEAERMTTLTIEEIVETFEIAASADEDVTTCTRTGLLAVIEKHIGPMLAEAFADGECGDTTEFVGCDPGGHWPTATDYAARILAQLKAKPHE